MTDQSHLVIDRLVHHSEMLATITNILNGLDLCMRELLRRVAMLEEALGTDPGWPPITDVPTGDKL